MNNRYQITDHLRPTEATPMSTDQDALQAQADYVTALRRQLAELAELNSAGSAVGFPRFDETRLQAELAQAETDLHRMRTGPGGDLGPAINTDSDPHSDYSARP